MRRSTRFLAIALPAALATVPVALAGADSASGGSKQPASPVAAAALAEATEPPPALIARVEPGATIALRTRPNGPVALRAGDTTEFGSPRRLGVVRRQGRYGCCILAISATQPRTPPGWTGGDRMAIHGTSDPASIGAASSAGCLRAADDDLELLMSRVPVGTPVVIRR